MNEPFNKVLIALWADLSQPEILWQVGTLVLCLLVALQVSQWIRIMPQVEASGVWKLGYGGLKRILFPLLALVLVLIGRALLRHWQHVNLLHVAVPLLGSLALIRVLFYALRHVFPPGGMLAPFERAIALLVWGGVALHMLGVLPDVVAFLEAVNFNIGKQRISLWLVLQALFWVLLTLLAALWGGSAVEARLMRAETLHSSLRAVLSRLTRAVLLLLAVLIVLPVLGIDLTVLSVFGGALGVGLGFGLQKVASNYISGFIILLERSIRLGDHIIANNFFGEVKGITTRHVILRGGDGREAMIPNDSLITSTVVSHTHSDKRIRLGVQVQISYDSDVERAIAVLVDVAAAHPRVIAHPPPNAFIINLGENGVELELGFWIEDPEHGNLNVRSDISRAILAAFRREAISIPFPQREIRHRNADIP
ncbi:MAG: mechanosensitive ion channel [Betaproteobacteria bacterium]|nr:mechanosensitive ion channel [Betaproteobacteria bacterium]